ncbi:MAG: glycosyltransferase family 4 protein, partial [Thermoplasmata archaeon]
SFMKIIQVCPYFYPHIGGVESHVLSLSKALVGKDHKVAVYTSKYENNLKDHEVIDNIEIHRIKTAMNLFTTPIFPKVKKILKKEEADVIHAHTPPPFAEYYVSRACKRTKIPFVVTYHCDPEIPNILSTPITGIYRRTFGYYALIHTDKIIVHTETYGATSRAIWKFDPVIIPSAIDINRFRPDNDGSVVRKKHGLEGKKVVLYVGRFKYHKGLEYLVEAATKLDKDTYFILVGSGDYYSTLKKLIIKNDLQDRFIFPGHVSADLLTKYYAAADVFALPSVLRLEAFGLVIVEAMATGKPVVISDIPGVREVIEDNVHGYLVEPANSSDLAEKLEILLKDPKLCKKIGRAGRKKVEESFNWDKVVKNILDVYESIQ